MIVECAEHGKALWIGDVSCGACGKVYLAQGTNPYRQPEVCACGKRLSPSMNKDEPFSARPVCRQCAMKATGGVGELVHILKPEEQVSWCGRPRAQILVHGGINAPDICDVCAKAAVAAKAEPPLCKTCGYHHDNRPSVVSFFHGRSA